ncbi:MAG: hypothetical protein ACXWVG_03010 [Telluria sp.]
MALHPQEIYLIERYTSLEYFGELRDTWARMVAHVEQCLQVYMQHISPDYRLRQLPEQPDIVWGEHVLPNFRNTLQSLNTGFILLSHGDYSGLKYSHGPSNDFKGQREFWAGWMSESQRSEYFFLLAMSSALASNISTTEGGYWNPGDLTTRCDAKERGILVPPSSWPNYRVNCGINVRTGSKVSMAGIYIPDVDASCAQFLSPSQKEAPPAKVLIEVRDIFSPVSGKKYDEELVMKDEPCLWNLVERTPDIVPATVLLSMLGSTLHRTQAGHPCVETGYYITPARTDSRRHFIRGEIMPEFDTGYGMTIWQWDANQE